jgi:uncharacterized membrane protein YbhN (UPF0104 family)
MPRIRSWAGVVRVVFGVGLLGALVYYVDPASVFPLFSKIAPHWLAAASICIVLATLIGALNLYLLLGHDRRLAFAAMLPLYWVSWAVGLVVPGQVGDVASITALMHRRGYVWQAVLSRSLLDKFISFVVLSGFALAGIGPWLTTGFFVYATVGVVAIIAVMYFTWRVQKSTERTLFAKAWRLVRSLVDEISRCCAETPGRVALNFVLSIVKVLFVGVAYWSVFHALGSGDVPLLRVVVLAAASSLVAYIPLSFNGIGTVEVAGIALFSSLGISSASVLAAYLLLRVTVMILAWLPAAVWLLFSRQQSTGQSLR